MPWSEGVYYSTGEEHKSESEMDCPWNSLGQDMGVGSLSLLQGIFPTQGSNPGLLHCRLILYQLCHKGSPIREELLQNVIHWRKWQPTQVYLPQEPHEQYEKAKWYDSGR